MDAAPVSPHERRRIEIDRHREELADCIVRANDSAAVRMRLSELQDRLGELIASSK